MIISRKIKLLSTAAALAVIAFSASDASAARNGRGYYNPNPQPPLYAQQPVRAAEGGSYASDPSVPFWAGPYVGGHIGGAWADFTNQDGVAGPSGSAGSLTGGAQVGYLWQSNRFVYGAEGDWSWLNLSSNTPGTHFHEGYTVTARGRLGYAVGPWLPYLTGGVAFTNTRFENAGGSAENMAMGFTAGGGIEKFIAPHWSAKAEYLYVDVPRDSEVVAGTSIAGGSGNSTVRVGLNYHF